jgi:hypothetical protein
MMEFTTLKGWQSGQDWKQYILEQNSAVDSWGAQQLRSNTQWLSLQFLQDIYILTHHNTCIN